MKLNKLAPWNWFNDKDPEYAGENQAEFNRLKNFNDVPQQGQGALIQPLRRFHDEIDRLYGDFIAGFRAAPDQPNLWTRFRAKANWLRSSIIGRNLNVSGSEDTYAITLDMPGFNKTEISLEAHNGVLIITGQKSAEAESKSRNFYCLERRYGAFQRTLHVPHDADLDRATASAKDGVLKIAIPKTEKHHALPEHVKIKVSE